MNETPEKWKQVCALAEKEENPNKLMELVAEVIRLFDLQHNRSQQGSCG
jgi:hypothetical protein